MKPLNSQSDLTPEERALRCETVYGPPVLTQEKIMAAMEDAALETQTAAERTFFVYGPPNANPAAPAFMSMQAQMQQAMQKRESAGAGKWKCGKCGAENSGRFCTECGARKPEQPPCTVRAYQSADLPQMTAIWNEIVEAGNAFPQEEPLTAETGAAFFAQQTYTGVAEQDGRILGLYILHPNNVGRCGHICNASYAVAAECRGMHIGEQLVLDCMKQGKAHGFRILQFNAVVESNVHARHLYERLGFSQLGTIKGGFRLKSGEYENICPYYKNL